MKLKSLINSLPLLVVLLVISWQLWQQRQQTPADRPDYEDPTATQSQQTPADRFDYGDPTATQSQPDLINANRPAPQSQSWQVVPGSVYDGDTLRVRRGVEELKIRFCGIDAPEKKQPHGIESRDYLRSLIAKGDGSVILVPVEKDRYGRTVAELFVKPRPGQGYPPEGVIEAKPRPSATRGRLENLEA